MSDRLNHGLGRCLALLVMALVACASQAQAQGQDSTPGERNVLIMAELLPGEYDNGNQAMFDVRRKLPEGDRHVRMHASIKRISAPAFGEFVFLWVNTTGSGDDAKRSFRIATLAAGPADDEVTMRHYFRMQGEITETDVATLTPAALQRSEGCDYQFKRRADHFRGRQSDKTCRFDWEGQKVYTDNEILLSQGSLWTHDHKLVIRTGQRITGVASGEPFWLERARIFHCYADIPGVAGGRDIPFERYDDIVLHDKGGSYWFKTREAKPRDIGLMLQAVTWPILNERGGNFNRDSLVLYALERFADGSVKNMGYAFTEPGAERIGNNLQWMLINCAMTPRDQARPEF